MSEDSPAAVARTLAARCPVIGPTPAPCEPLAAIVCGWWGLVPVSAVSFATTTTRSYAGLRSHSVRRRPLPRQHPAPHTAASGTLAHNIHQVNCGHLQHMERYQDICISPKITFRKNVTFFINCI